MSNRLRMECLPRIPTARMRGRKITGLPGLLPFRASEEDLDTVASDLQRLPNALAWPAAWNTNAFAQKAAEFYIEGLLQAFPQRVITPPIAYVNSVSELLATSLGSPSTPVRSLARKVFQVIKERCTEQSERKAGHQTASAVA